MTRTFSIASADIAAEEFDGEYVVLNVASGHYFSLADGAALVWRALTDGHSVDAVVGQLAPDDAVRDTIEALVASFTEHDLLAPAEREAPVNALQAVATAEMTFELAVFDDLADLLIADPVHDVDEEAGWPHLPPK